MEQSLGQSLESSLEYGALSYTTRKYVHPTVQSATPIRIARYAAVLRLYTLVMHLPGRFSGEF